jgi:hypothetical protein
MFPMIGAPLVTTINTCFILTEAFPEVKLTVPPHLKAKPSNSNVPVVGSRKRKARKHSIAHLLPVKSLLKPS